MDLQAHAFEVVLSVLLALLSYIWWDQKNQNAAKHQDTAEKLKGVDKTIEDTLLMLHNRLAEHFKSLEKRDELEQKRREETLKFLQTLVEDARDSTNQIVAQIYTDLREFKQDRRRSDEEVFRQINDIRVRMSQLELAQVGKFYTKEEVEKLLVPLQHSLSDLKLLVGDRRNAHKE